MQSKKRVVKQRMRSRFFRSVRNASLQLEPLERRYLLTAVNDVYDISPNDPGVRRMGFDLAVAWEEYRQFEQSNTFAAFRPSNDSLPMFGERVIIDAVASGTAAELQADFAKAGIAVTGAFDRSVSALVPVDSIGALADMASLAFAMPAYSGSAIGATTTQGDQSMGSDTVKSLLGLDGTGVDIAVLSDSFANLPGANVGIASGDLPGPGNPNGLTNAVNVIQELPLGVGNEVQQIAINGAPTGGNFTLTFNDGGTIAPTGPIPFNATAAQVQAALVALPNIAVGDVAVVGGPLPGAFVQVTFQNNLANANFRPLVANGAGLTGGVAPNVVVTTVNNGASGTDEGRAMLEIVHDIVPAADLLFATASLGQGAFAANIAALQAAGADVIIDDIFYFGRTLLPGWCDCTSGRCCGSQWEFVFCTGQQSRAQFLCQQFHIRTEFCCRCICQRGWCPRFSGWSSP